MIREKRVSYKGGKIFYRISGEGDITLILIHGYLGSSGVWDRFMTELSKHFRVIAPDLPGNGDSDCYDEDHSMCFHAGAILSVMDAEKVDRAVMAGHSLGGYVTLSFVENYPDRLFSYILFHSHPFADTDEAKANRLREINIVEQGRKESIYPVNIPKMFANQNVSRFSYDVERLKDIASAQSGDGIISVLLGMINRRARIDILSREGLQVLYILGRHDNYIPLETIIQNLEIPKHCRLEVLNESGHLGFLEETGRSVQLVMDFIMETAG